MASPAQRDGNYRGPAMLSYGFRPFFLFSALWAALSLSWFRHVPGRGRSGSYSSDRVLLLAYQRLGLAKEAEKLVSLSRHREIYDDLAGQYWCRDHGGNVLYSAGCADIRAYRRRFA